MESDSYSILICANVLNVIQSDVSLHETVKQMSQVSCPVIISVYEGNRSGDGKVTTKGYQRNLPAREYEWWLKQYFSEVKRKGNKFICQ